MVYLDVFVLGWFIIADEDVPVAGNPLDIAGLDVLAESQVKRFLEIVFFGPSVQEKPVILFDNDFGTIGLRDFQRINNRW